MTDYRQTVVTHSGTFSFSDIIALDRRIFISLNNSLALNIENSQPLKLELITVDSLCTGSLESRTLLRRGFFVFSNLERLKKAYLPC
jgi:hypothetical protein